MAAPGGHSSGREKLKRRRSPAVREGRGREHTQSACSNITDEGVGMPPHAAATTAQVREAAHVFQARVFQTGIVPFEHCNPLTRRAG